MQSSWNATRRDVLSALAKSGFALSAAPWLGALAGCGGEKGSGTPAAPTPALSTQPVPAGPLTSASLTVTGTQAGVMPDRFLGLSYEKGDFATQGLFNGGNTLLANLFNSLGNGVLRIGGNSVEKSLWTAAGAGKTAKQIAPPDVDALAAFIALTGWKILYGVNLATSTPELAAQEVAYAQSRLGTALIGFEIGNEPDLYGNLYFTGWTLQDFEARWSQFRAAILAVTPGAVITGPADSGHVADWTVPFARYAGSSQISLLTQHYYRANGQSASSTAAQLVTPDPNLAAVCNAMSTAATAIGVPWRMAETNSYYNGGAPGASDTYASALWVIDHLLTIALGGGTGVNLHGGNNGPYTPIQNSGAVAVAAKPEYYGMLLVALAGRGNLLRTTLSAGGLNVTAYALQTSTGFSIIVVNKEVTQNVSLAIALSQPASHGTITQLLGTGLTATTGQTLGGTTIALSSVFTPATQYAPASLSGSAVNCYVPALSAVLLQLG